MTKAASASDITAICQAYREGQSCHAIATAWKRTAPGILRILKKAGVPVAASGAKQPLRKMTPELTERAAVLYAEGSSLHDIGQLIGVTPVAIRRALLKQGHSTRPKTRQKNWQALEQAVGKLLCTACQQPKDPSDFASPGQNSRAPRGHAYVCRECQRWNNRERTYGMTRQDYEQRLTAQGGLCAICKKPWAGNTMNPDLVVDHDHSTGTCRGLLCPHCNHLLGNAFDSPEILGNAVLYLMKHRAPAKP